MPDLTYVYDDYGNVVRDADGDPFVSDNQGNYAVQTSDGSFAEPNYEDSYEGDTSDYPPVEGTPYDNLTPEQKGEAAGRAIMDLAGRYPEANQWIQETYGELDPEPEPTPEPKTFAQEIDQGLDEAIAEQQPVEDGDSAPETV